LLVVRRRILLLINSVDSKIRWALRVFTSTMTNQQTALPQQPNEERGTYVLPYDPRPESYQAPVYERVQPGAGQYSQYPEYYQQPARQYAPYMIADPSTCMRVVQTECVVVSKEPFHGGGCGCQHGGSHNVMAYPQKAPRKFFGFGSFLKLAVVVAVGFGVWHYAKPYVTEAPKVIAQATEKIPGIGGIIRDTKKENAKKSKKKKSSANATKIAKGGNAGGKPANKLVPPPPPFIPSGAVYAAIPPQMMQGPFGELSTGPEFMNEPAREVPLAKSANKQNPSSDSSKSEAEPASPSKDKEASNNKTEKPRRDSGNTRAIAKLPPPEAQPGNLLQSANLTHTGIVPGHSAEPIPGYDIARAAEVPAAAPVSHLAPQAVHRDPAEQRLQQQLQQAYGIRTVIQENRKRVVVDR
jgi:hypothetical protein